MSEENEQGSQMPKRSELEELERNAAKVALRLVDTDKDSHDKVLDGIMEMGEYYSPIVEEDVNIAKLQNGLFALSDMRNFRVTRVDQYIGNYLGQAYGSAAAMESQKAKLETARIYSSLELLRRAFAAASTDDHEIDEVRLKEFMMAEVPSAYWSNQSGTKVAINNVIESYTVAKQLAAGLEQPVTVDQLMAQLVNEYRIQGMGIADLPSNASEIEQQRWKNEVAALVEAGWQSWLEKAHRENAPDTDNSLSS